MKGVGIPTASAILTIVFPNKYAIIDISCMEILLKLKILKSKNISIDTWIDYLGIVRFLARENSAWNYFPHKKLNGLSPIEKIT